MNHRSPAVAGQFYPENKNDLSNLVHSLMAQNSSNNLAAKALIVPHAGYAYSGEAAGKAFVQLSNTSSKIKNIVIIGPSHHVDFEGLALPSHHAFSTPMGNVPLEVQQCDRLVRSNTCKINDQVHEKEHSIEIMLPFIQAYFPQATIVPILTGRVDPRDVQSVIEELWGGEETIFIISTDLSHFLTDTDARETDLSTADCIERLNINGLHRNSACGRVALSGMLLAAAAKDLRITRLMMYNSAEKNDNKDRVVGYGAWAFEHAYSARLNPEHRGILKHLAKWSIFEGAGSNTPPVLNDIILDTPLKTKRACFTTLTVNGKFRGCQGSLTPHESVASSVVSRAWASAYHDPRFKPFSEEEAEKVEVGISILSHMRRMKFKDEADLIDMLRPDIDGIVLADGEKRSLFLPKVWQDLPDPRNFIGNLKVKGGWQRDEWPPNMQAYRFTAEYF